MLPMLGQTASRINRRTVLLLAVLAAFALAIPTLKWAGGGPLGTVAAQGAPDANAAADPDIVAAAAPDRDKPSSKGVVAGAGGTAEYLPRPTKDEERILAALEEPLTVEFRDVALEECIQFIRKQAHLDIYVEKDALIEEGIAVDQPVTLELQGRRVESVLKLLLRPCQLTFLVEDDVLKITTSTKAQDKLITRTYPVRDLYGEPVAVAEDGYTGGGFFTISSNEPVAVVDVPQPTEARDGSRSPGRFVLYQGFGAAKGGGGGGLGAIRNPFSALMRAIESEVEPDSWEMLSGPGSMSPVPQSGCLVIRQTWAIHRQILQLLRDLRAAKGNAAGDKK